MRANAASGQLIFSRWLHVAAASFCVPAFSQPLAGSLRHGEKWCGVGRGAGCSPLFGHRVLSQNLAL
ncbi:MAG TPA: hypothetical protein PK858_00685, partial [Saprospiraceae bacterium]|nr:hypothetical protein [Saprospiraceae bacterium]